MSTFGRAFRVTTCGESHSAAVAVIIDGIPSGIPLTAAMIQPAVQRRRPGQSTITTARSEEDLVEIFCGTERYPQQMKRDDNAASAQGDHDEEGEQAEFVELTLGTPIGVRVRNKDQRPQDYKGMVQNSDAPVPRPSHADLTYRQKYNGVVANSGGGRASARETLTRVVAGAVAEIVLKHIAPSLKVVAYTHRIGPHSLVGDDSKPQSVETLLTTLDQLPSSITPISDGLLTRQVVDAQTTRFPVLHLDPKAVELLTKLKTEDGDSVGGVVGCVVEGCPPGLGEPVFDKLEAVLGHAMMSIPATKAFQVGSGTDCGEAFGSHHNDAFVGASDSDGSVLHTRTNKSGGIQGGISNGGLIYFKVSFKPPATISKPQQTSNLDGEEVVLEGKGRHDPCVVPRAVPVVEAMTLLVLLDMILLQQRQKLIVPANMLM